MEKIKVGDLAGAQELLARIQAAERAPEQKFEVSGALAEKVGAELSDLKKQYVELASQPRTRSVREKMNELCSKIKALEK